MLATCNFVEPSSLDRMDILQVGSPIVARCSWRGEGSSIRQILAGLALPWCSPCQAARRSRSLKVARAIRSHFLLAAWRGERGSRRQLPTAQGLSRCGRLLIGSLRLRWLRAYTQSRGGGSVAHNEHLTCFAMFAYSIQIVSSNICIIHSSILIMCNCADAGVYENYCFMTCTFDCIHVYVFNVFLLSSSQC